ncbi:MAG: hypothetical protein AAGA15_00260 [Pseudomonadota bacterium]
MKRILTTLCICLLPMDALADWRTGPGSEILAGTTSAFGVTELGVGALGVMCRAGEPFIWTQGWAPAAAGADRQEAFQVSVGGQLHTVTGQHAPPDGLWTGRSTAALIDALKAGSTAIVATQSAGSVSVSLRGSSRAINSVLSDCEGRVDADATRDSGGGPILFDQLIAQMCGGGYALVPGAKLSGLLDDDDQPDLVLDWGGVTCDDRSKGRGAGFCGTALCTIEVALTQTQSRQQMLGVNPEVVARAFGAQALKTTTQGRSCGGPAQTCDVIWIWNGTELEAQR